MLVSYACLCYKSAFMKIFIFYLLVIICIVSCGVKKSPVAPVDDRNIESSSDDDDEEK